MATYAPSGTPLVLDSRLHVLVYQAFEHEAHHIEIDLGLAGSRQEFVTFAHPAISVDPGDRLINNPATWQELGAWQSCW